MPVWNFLEEIAFWYWNTVGKLIWPLFENIDSILRTSPYLRWFAIPMGLSVIQILVLLGIGLIWAWVAPFARRYKMGSVDKKLADRLYWVLTLVFSGLAFAVVGVGLSAGMHVFTSTTTQVFANDFESFLGLTFLFTVISAVATGLLSWPYYLLLLIKNLFKVRAMEKFLPAVRGIIFVFGLLSSICFWLYIDEPNFPNQAMVLNAAIKNTCLYDPRKENCPQKLEDIGIVEPENFAAMQAVSQMKYSYDPATNQYTFIVRYGKRNGIIFDQRLSPKLDLKPVQFETLGVDHVIDPPAYPGPWDNWPDWDKGF